MKSNRLYVPEYVLVQSRVLSSDICTPCATVYSHIVQFVWVNKLNLKMSFHLLSGIFKGVGGIIVKTIPGNMYHLNTCEINFTKKSQWVVVVILLAHVGKSKMGCNHQRRPLQTSEGNITVNTTFDRPVCILDNVPIDGARELWWCLFIFGCHKSFKVTVSSSFTLF